MSFPFYAKADLCGILIKGSLSYKSKTLPLFCSFLYSGGLRDPHVALFLGEDLAVLGISLFRSINLDYHANKVNNIVIGIS